MSTDETAEDELATEIPESEAVPTEEITTNETAASEEQPETQTDGAETPAVTKVEYPTDGTAEDIEDELDQEWQTGTTEETV